MLLNITNYAKYRGCSRETIYHSIKLGKLKTEVISGITFIDTELNKGWYPGRDNGRPKRNKI